MSVGELNLEIQKLYDRRWCERVSVHGAAAVLELGHLGIVYEIMDISLGGARLKGGRALPGTYFDVLLSVSGRYVECRARSVWDDREYSDSLGIEFETLHAGTWLDWPEDDPNRGLGAI